VGTAHLNATALTTKTMNESDYLPLAYLNAWEYCPRRFYLKYQLGEMADNEHILMGAIYIET